MVRITMQKYTVGQMTELIETKLSHNFGVKPAQASDEFFYKACAMVLMDIMKERRGDFKDEAAEAGSKQVYYLSMEFLMGRSFKNTLYNLGLEKVMAASLEKLGVRLDRLYDLEPDAGLGNGGLGRLAACFLDGLSTGGYPAMGYCIKYDYGIFRQKLVEGWQTEMPEFWLPGGGVWLEARYDAAVDVKFDGQGRPGRQPAAPLERRQARRHRHEPLQPGRIRQGYGAKRHGRGHQQGPLPRGQPLRGQVPASQAAVLLRLRHRPVHRAPAPGPVRHPAELP